MNVTLSIDEQILEEARRRAEAVGTSVNQSVREYLQQFAGRSTLETDAAEFVSLSRAAQGHSAGWRFDREELHERR